MSKATFFASIPPIMSGIKTSDDEMLAIVFAVTLVLGAAFAAWLQVYRG